MKRLCVASCLVAIIGLCADGASTVIPAPGGVGDVAAFEAAMQTKLTGTEVHEIILSAGTYTLDHTITNQWFPLIVRGATGNRGDVIIDGQNACRCLHMIGKFTYGDPAYPPKYESRTVRLKDVTIRNGLRQGDVGELPSDRLPNGAVGGGGAYVLCGYVENCAFINCHVKSTSLYAVGGGLSANCVGVTNCYFESCSAQSSTSMAYGGGLGYSDMGYSKKLFSLGNCTFTNCSSWVTGTKANNKQSFGGAFCDAAGLPIENVRCYGCFATNSVGYGGFNDSQGGAAFLRNSAVIRDCYFTNCSARVGGAIYGNKDGLVVSNSTFVGNTSTYYNDYYLNWGSVIGVGGGNLQNVLFAGNQGGVQFKNGSVNASSCVFKDNVGIGGWGAAGLYAGGALDIADCVFTNNLAKYATANGGALCCSASALTHTVRVERCVFVGNAAGIGPNDYYSVGGSALNFRGLSTNNVIRNCHFLRNAKSPVVAFGSNDSYTDTLGIELRFENCSFVENTCTGMDYNKNKYGCIFSTLVPLKGSNHKNTNPYLFLENCLIFGNTDFNIGVFSSKFCSDYSNQVQYCASDMSKNFPAEENGNFLITKAKQARNKGLNRDWMAGASDGGDGTYTISPYREYGVKVALNNVHKRVLRRSVDIGASEHNPKGLVILFR